MKLLNVRLDAFGQFNRGLDITFDPARLNLVVGRNEAGKSTLLSAICGTLFGFRDLNLTRRYEPWADHASYSGSVTFAADDGAQYRVARDFEASTAEVTRLDATQDATQGTVVFSGSADPRGTTRDDQRYFELLGTLLGIQDESVFRNTVFVGQMSLRAEVSDQIRRLLSGSGNVDYKGALHELHSRYSDLTSENPWRSKADRRRRALEQSRESLGAAERDLASAHAGIRRHGAIEREISALGARRDQTEAAIAEARERATQLERGAALIERRDEAARRLSEAESRSERFQRTDERIKSIEERVRRDFSHFRNAPEDLPDLVVARGSELSGRDSDAAALAAEAATLEALRPVPNAGLGWTVGAILFAGSAIAGFTTALGEVPGLIAATVLGALGVVVGRNINTGFREQRAAHEARIGTLKKSIAGREGKIAEYEAGLGQLLLGRVPERLIAEYREFRALVEERRRLIAALKGIGEAEAVTESLADARRETGRIEAGLDQLGAAAPWMELASGRTRLNAVALEIRDGITRDEARLTVDRARTEELRVELATLSGRLDFDVPHLAETVRDESGRVRELELRKDALKEAIDALDGCIKDFQESDVFRLADEMSSIFSMITGGKYERVHLGPSLEPLVAAGDRVGINPDDLSQGARDQLYLSMRIALVRHLSRSVRLPIFLDDPFVNFDAERLGVTRKVLESLPDHQVIMVTCDRQYEKWTSAVIDLDRAHETRIG